MQRRAGFSFKLMAVDRTTSAAWYSAAPGSAAMGAMKAALHRGNVASLNLYSSALPDDLLGMSWYPWNISDVTQDGVT